MVILGSLSPTDLQHREEAPFTKRTDFSGVEPGDFQYHCQLVGSAPTLWVLL